MSIYIAASFTKRDTVAKPLAEKLKHYGIDVVSRWIDSVGAEDTAKLPIDAIMDMEDIRQADSILCVTGDIETRGGRHTEVGLALAWHKKIYLLGPREQVFHYHPKIVVCKDFDEFLKLYK